MSRHACVCEHEPSAHSEGPCEHVDLFLDGSEEPCQCARYEWQGDE